MTKAGWLSSLNQKTEKTITFDSGAPTDRKSHSFKDLGTTVSSRDEADLQVFLSHSGFMSVSDTYRIRAYRMWELINNDAGNIMVEPSFNIQVLQGNPADVTQVSGGNAVGNWLDVTPTGTDIVAVTYDAIDLYNDKDVARNPRRSLPGNRPRAAPVCSLSRTRQPARLTPSSALTAARPAPAVRSGTTTTTRGTTLTPTKPPRWTSP